MANFRRKPHMILGDASQCRPCQLRPVARVCDCAQLLPPVRGRRVFTEQETVDSVFDLLGETADTSREDDRTKCLCKHGDATLRCRAVRQEDCVRRFDRRDQLCRREKPVDRRRSGGGWRSSTDYPKRPWRQWGADDVDQHVRAFVGAVQVTYVQR